MRYLVESGGTISRYGNASSRETAKMQARIKKNEASWIVIGDGEIDPSTMTVEDGTLVGGDGLEIEAP